MTVREIFKRIDEAEVEGGQAGQVTLRRGGMRSRGFEKKHEKHGQTLKTTLFLNGCLVKQSFLSIFYVMMWNHPIETTIYCINKRHHMNHHNF